MCPRDENLALSEAEAREVERRWEAFTKGRMTASPGTRLAARLRSMTFSLSCLPAPRPTSPTPGTGIAKRPRAGRRVHGLRSRNDGTGSTPSNGLRGRSPFSPGSSAGFPYRVVLPAPIRRGILPLMRSQDMLASSRDAGASGNAIIEGHWRVLPPGPPADPDQSDGMFGGFTHPGMLIRRPRRRNHWCDTFALQFLRFSTTPDFHNHGRESCQAAGRDRDQSVRRRRLERLRMKVYHGRRTDHGCAVDVEEDGEVTLLNPRLDLRNHSPSGFEWGYGAAGRPN